MAFNPYMQQPQYGQYNALAPYQQQLANMQQQYQQPAQQPMSIKGWAVTGEDVARKAIIELDGSLFIFPDVQNGKVYSKQINTADFSPIFRTYQLVDTQERKVEVPDMTGYVSKQDFEKTVQYIKEEIERVSVPQKLTKEASTK